MSVEPLSAAPPERVRHPVMRQSWQDLTFLHWPYPVADVRRLVPPDLGIETYDGAAWVGLVPFRISGLTLPGAPSVPWLSGFPETNVRTYVVDGRGRRGVWFFSLDAARLPAVVGARSAYGLPYYWSRMEVHRAGDVTRYRSVRRHGPPAASNIEIRSGELLHSHSDLEVFLTARFRLYARLRGRLVRADVEHPPWPLHRATASRIAETLVCAAGLPNPAGTPLVHFAPRVDVLVSAPIRAESAG